MVKLGRNGPAPARFRVDVRVDARRDPEVVQWLWNNPRSAPKKIRELLRVYVAAERVAPNTSDGAEDTAQTGHHPVPASTIAPPGAPAGVPCSMRPTALCEPPALLSPSRQPLRVQMTPEAIRAKRALDDLIARASKPPQH